ncbi:uncharacterized protein LOC133905404 [Phragmites australis]|uniref:uncharacterized protein LOC133905404 n=1 Tax=Phragmites australis TaxID=29695 RepID=UPI002D7848B1|nr:uncharacterized protein LOC133905404 [Phragmites australis]
MGDQDEGVHACTRRLDAVEHDDPKEKVDMKKDQIALTAIYQGIPEETLRVVLEKETSKEAWECIKMMPSDKMEDLYVVRKILRATPNKFLQIVASIKQFGDLETMTVEEVFGRLQAYKERLHGNDNDVDINAEHVLLTKARWRAKEKDGDKHLLLTREQWRAKEQKDGGDGYFNSGGRGSKNQKFDKAKVRCYKCNDYGHFQWKCEESKKPENMLFMAAEEDDHPVLL